MQLLDLSSLCSSMGVYHARLVRIHHPPGGVGRYLFRTKTFEYHFCRRCGCVMYYRRVHTRHPERIAVNARMMDPAEIASIPVRTLDVRKKR